MSGVRRFYRLKFFWLLLAAMWRVLPAAVQAQFAFTTNSDNTITINGYNTAAGLDAVIPNSTNGYPVTSIGVKAFQYSTVTSVTIPDSVTNIGVAAFVGLSLTNISVNVSNLVYSSLSGVLFDKAQATLLQFPGGLGGSYTIPNSVTSIGTGAFAVCTNLTTVTFPNSVNNIETNAFYGCTRLTNVTFPNSVTSIGISAFEDCYSLTNVTIPNSVTNIGVQAFESCTRLTSVTLGNGVTSIESAAFDYCSSLTSMIIPDSVITIFPDAFVNCTSLTNVIIGNGVTRIGDYAFVLCSSLTSVTIGDSVTNIGVYVFEDCLSLFSVTIPASVTNIGDAAFFACGHLTEIYFQGNPPSIPSDAFTGVNSALTIYYLPNTIGWGATFDGFPTALTPPPNGLISVGGLPAVFYPPADTNYTLQISTNPESGNWVAVSNSVVLNCLQITNFSNAAFFRLQAASGSVPSPVIGSYGALPVWIYPTNASYSLQMNTNLAAGNWMAATSGLPFISVQITNARPTPSSGSIKPDFASV
jgi:hypothetical protein